MCRPFMKCERWFVLRLASEDNIDIVGLLFHSISGQVHLGRIHSSSQYNTTRTEWITFMSEYDESSVRVLI